MSTSTREETLWRRVDECLFYQCQQKKSDATPRDTLNRLILERVGEGLKNVRFSEHNCGIRLKLRPTHELHAFDRKHERVEPLREGGPIVVFAHQGSVYVIDGNNRINVWKEQPSMAPPEVEVIVIEYPRG